MIGRSPENELQIYGEEVSREHSEIVSAAGQFQLIDHSSNGTFVNGKRIKRHKLEEQDLIQIGDNKFEFQESESAAPTKEDVGTEVKFVPHLTRSTSTQVFGREELDQTLLLDTSAQVSDVAAYRQIHQNLATIYKVGNLINSTENPRELFDTLMDTIIDVIHPERAFLLLRDPETNDINPVVVRCDVADNERLPLSQTIVQDCITKSQHVLCPDAMMDERFKTGESIFINQIRSVMCVPLESQKQILGAI
ncbi:MAG: FHA domain-containing protein, partial [Planctomycetota bacterium]|nr:FHA domain-containing protein [Planctomycetota bacterium]